MPGRELSEDSLKQAALHYLERYSTSSANLRAVLMRRVRRRTRDELEAAEAKLTIERIIVRFAEVGLLDDRAYAERRAEMMHRQGKSLRAVRADLMGRGVARDVAGEVVRLFEAKLGDPDLSAAVAYAKKRRLGPFRPDDRDTHKNKDAGRLLRRGFDWDIVTKILAAHSPDELRVRDPE
jgi:regulatory protein